MGKTINQRIGKPFGDVDGDDDNRTARKEVHKTQAEETDEETLRKKDAQEQQIQFLQKQHEKVHGPVDHAEDEEKPRKRETYRSTE